MLLKPWTILGMGVVVLSSLFAGRAIAGTIELQVFQLLSRSTSPTSRCPDTITVTETYQPYREGSYGIDGNADLRAISSAITLAERTPFSVTWVGTLTPPYRQCQAAAGMVRVEGGAYQGHSYIRMRFMDGKAYLILDMTGLRDPNNYTTVITQAAVQHHRPTWSWGGSD